MAAYRRKDGKPLAADETVVTVDLRGFEYCKLPTLARTLDISANQMREVLADFCTTHEIRVLELGPRMQLVNVRDFRRALMARGKKGDWGKAAYVWLEHGNAEKYKNYIRL